MTKEEACEILGVEENATATEIKQAWRDLVSVWHPDKHGDNNRRRQKAEEQTKLINAAYEILKKAPRSRSTRPKAQQKPKTRQEPKEEHYPPPPPQEEPQTTRNENKGCVGWIVGVIIMIGIISFLATTNENKEKMNVDASYFTQETREILECEKCSIDFPNEKEAQQHANEYGHIVTKSFQKEEWRCNDCSFATQDGKSMQKHEKFSNHVSNIFWTTDSISYIYPKVPRIQLECEKCSIKFSSEDEHQHATQYNHIVKNLIQKIEYRCTDCSFKTHDGKSMHEHHEETFNHGFEIFWTTDSASWIHPVPKIQFECEGCLINLSNEADAPQHANEYGHIVKKKFQKIEWRCEDCSFKTHDGKILLEHREFFGHASKGFWKTYSTSLILPDPEIQKAIDPIMEQFGDKVTWQEVFPKLMEFIESGMSAEEASQEMMKLLQRITR